VEREPVIRRAGLRRIGPVDRAQQGFTLIEVLIAVTLLGLITGALTGCFLTAINGTQAGAERVRESNDAQITAAFLTRDAQAAGGTNPVTGSLDTTLGVSLTDAAGCTGPGSMVVRFKWVDRASSAVAHKRVASYWFDSGAKQLVRVSCTDAAADPLVTLANHVGVSPAPPIASCNPTAACPGLPDTVSITVSEMNVPQNAPTPYTYTLTASLRPEAQTAPSGSSSTNIPLLLLANGSSCPADGALAMSSQGGGNSTLRVHGGAFVSGYSPNCPSVKFQGSVDYEAAEGTSVLAPGSCQGTTCGSFTAPIGDPFATLTPPPATCSGGANPTPLNGHYPPGTYPQALIVVNATFDPGAYVFCNGLATSGTVVAANVLFYFSGGSLNVSGGTFQSSAQTNPAYAGIVVWQRAGNTTPFNVCCNNNVVATFDGAVYVPGAVVTLHNGTISVKLLIALAVAWSGGGNGGTSIGTVPPALAITGPASLPAWTRNVAYPSTTITSSGGDGGNAWTATGLPAGLGINPVTGVISGTPTASGTFSVQVKVTDVFNATATRAYTVTINAQPSISTVSLPSWTINRPYPSTTVATTGGTAPFTWSAAGLPAGLSMATGTGVISGTPTATGTSTVTVVVTDAAGSSATRSYTVAINAPPAVTTTALPDAERNVAYSATLTRSGGTAPFTWSAAGLPSGLSLNTTTGVISGTPGTTGTFTVNITLADASGATASGSASLVVSPQLTITGPASLPAWTRGRAYPSTTVTASGGKGAYTWSATGLPSALSINAVTGAISGTPSASGTFTVVVSVTDSASPSFTTTRTYTLTINAPPAITPTSNSVKKNKAFTFTPGTTGGTLPFTWSISGQPAWVALNPSTGVLSGTPPNSTGTFTFTLTVTDAAGAAATVTYTLNVTN
jgi:prepilin-type N-terminal cleavage/methylation domain-containing protein